jgi:pyruvate ferredoxin oxidoreductase beta subunit
MAGKYYAMGDTACAGCAQAVAARLVVDTAGPDVIIANNTGCLEVFTSAYPQAVWRVPWIHSLFGNAAAVASGIEAGLIALGRKDGTHVIAQGGDGGTADIGIQSLSGMLERGHNILYVCYDNEAYMNTGIQRSGLTPFAASTTTSPSGRVSLGNRTRKKNLPEIAVAHGIPYVATASAGYPRDIIRKVKKALSLEGPKYLQVHVPCPLGWRHDSALTVEVAQSAVNSGLYPLIEFDDGKLGRVRRIRSKVPVEEYLRPQGRFRHLFRGNGAAEALAEIQAVADANIERYGLMA